MERLMFGILSWLSGFLARNRSASTGVLVFSVAFVLVTANAFYAQDIRHPSPFWNTQSEALTPRQASSTLKPQSLQTVSRSVLTHSISLKNIPVPTANPVRRYMEVPNNSSLVRDVQAELATIGLYPGKIDGIFGSGTQNAIVQFQQRAGILPNGEASYDLLTQLKSVTSALEQQGNTPVIKTQTTKKPPEMMVFDKYLVSKIQNGLKEKFADDTIVVDGVIGAKTRAAIRNFQRRFDLSVTGEPDHATVGKLLELNILESI